MRDAVERGVVIHGTCGGEGKGDRAVERPPRGRDGTLKRVDMAGGAADKAGSTCRGRQMDRVDQGTRWVINIHVYIGIGAGAGGAGRREGFPVKAIIQYVASRVRDVKIDAIVGRSAEVATDITQGEGGRRRYYETRTVRSVRHDLLGTLGADAVGLQ